MSRLAAAPARQATFREERRLAALSVPLQSAGTLSFEGGKLEKNTTWPQPERLQIDGDRLIITAGNAAPRVIDMAMAPELRILIDAIRAPLLGDAAAIGRAFHADAAGTLAGWTIALVPRDQKAAAFLRAVHLRGHEGWIDELAIAQANGDQQVMTITPR